MPNQKVIHIILNEPYNGQSVFYFGSVAAVYEHLPGEVLGVQYRTLCNALNASPIYRGRKFTASTGRLLTASKGKGGNP